VQLRLAPLTLLAGVGAAVGTVALYQLRWGFWLALVTVLALLFLAPRGWGTRLPYGVGFTFVVAVVSVSRGEGDFVLSDSARGYGVLALAMVVLIWSIATLPRPGRAMPAAVSPDPEGSVPPHGG
jgi:hypothetical protein